MQKAARRYAAVQGGLSGYRVNWSVGEGLALKIGGVGMIVGIGHDIVEIERVQHLVRGELGSRFLTRVLTEKERLLAMKRGGKLAEYTAGRFAAKEAVVKAFGCGIGAVLGFTDIEILPDPLGKPCCQLSQAAWARLALAERDIRIHIAITHERSMASAMAVVERL